jgi:hypothetical protein
MKNKTTIKMKYETDTIKLSDQQIDKHKNFKRLIHEYQIATTPLYKTPLYKNKRAFLVILLLILLVYIIMEMTV